MPKKVIDIKLGEPEPVKSKSEKKEELIAIIEAYKVQNPEKAAKKEKEFEKKLAEL